MAEGRVLHVSETVITTRLEIRDDLGTVVAHVIGTHSVEEDETRPEDSWPAFDRPLAPDDLELKVIGDGVAVTPTAQMVNGRGGLHGGALLAIAHEAHLHHHASQEVAGVMQG
jgi:acyl-coenzyme A thioesterase PaaI-like protein